MPTINFKISDNQKYNMLWSLLNVNYTEENEWVVEYGICDIYDEYAVVRNFADAKFERIYYTKNDETDSLEITNREDCFIVDVTASEKQALTAIHEMNNNTYEAADVMVNELKDNYSAALGNVETLTGENSALNTKIEECEITISTLTTERDNIQSLYGDISEQLTNANNELVNAQSTIATLTSERDGLASYKKNIEDTEKRNIINGYTDQLDAEIISSYTERMDNYTAEQLDMELTYKVKVTRPDLFAKTPVGGAYIPKDTAPQASGLEALLSKYEKK